MRKYAIIDTNITAGASEFITVCKNRAEAFEKADMEWNTLTKKEQKKRDGFIIGIIDVDEDNEPADGDVIVVVKDYKNEEQSSAPEDHIATIRELRALTGLSAQKFGDLYNIPLRTIQHWEGDDRTPPEYIISLLQRVVTEDFC